MRLRGCFGVARCFFRRVILDYCFLRRFILESYGQVAFDSINVTSNLLRYFDMLDAGETAPWKVINQFVEREVKLSSFTLSIQGKRYTVQFNKKVLNKKLASSIRGGDGIRDISLAKKVLIALANVERVLVEGKRTNKIETFHKNPNKHKGSTWLYVMDEIFEERPEYKPLNGDVILQIELMPRPNEENHIYTVVVEGGRRFDQKREMVLTKRAAPEDVRVFL